MYYFETAPNARADFRHAATAKTSDALVRPDVAREEILHELRDYYSDFSACDWPKFAAQFWPGATLTTIWKPKGEPGERVVITAVPEFVIQAPNGPGSKPIFEERMSKADVRMQGPLAH